MHEKTLLYGALGCTAIAAVLAVTLGRGRDTSSTRLEITPVSVTDAKTLASAEIPIRLTSSDGTGLRLQSLSANAVVEDPLALTELHLTFENPESRILEGTFRITLPQGASLSRFAMKVNGMWQEGEVVEKQAARRAYEDFLHRKQDPALMEQGAGNEFSARVFPIPANGIKEIMIAYTETIEAGAPYVLPLRGLPQLGTLDVDVHAAGNHAAAAGGKVDLGFSLHQQRITPAQDFVVEGQKLPRSAGLRSGDMAITRVVPFSTSRPEPIASAVVLVDTSASRGLGLPEQARLLQSVIARMNPDAPISVACFDQEVVPLYEGKAGGFGDKEVNAIIARAALGASDFEQALAWAGEQAKKSKAKRVVLVGDGVATAGETDAQKLKEKVERLRDAGVERMDAIAVGGIRDDAFLRTVVRGVLDRDGVVLDAKLGSDALARRLGEATSSGVPVKVEGATWSWPRTLDGLQAGDEIMVYARIDAAKPVKVTIGTQQISPDLRATDRPLVERAWAQAKIQSLVDAPTEDAASTKREIIALSTQHRVLSPLTAMLVLETDADYARFNIDRNATVDILTVKDGRIAIDHEPRSWEERQARAAAEQEKDKAKNGEGSWRFGAKKAEAPTAAASPRPSEPVATATAAPTAMASAMPPGLGGITDTTGTGASAGAAARDDSANRGAAAADSRDGHGAAPGSPAEERARALDEASELGMIGLSGIGEGGGGTGQGFGAGIGNAAGRQAGPSGATAGEALAAAPPPPAAVRRPSMGALESDDPFAADQPRRAPPPHAQPTPRPDVGGSTTNTAQVRPGALVIEGGINQGEVQRVVRAAAPRMRACYTSQLSSNPSVRGHMDVRVVVDALGDVKSAEATTSPSAELKGCVQGVFRALRFPAPGTGDARFTASFDFVSSGAAIADDSNPTNAPKASPYDGRFKVVMDRLGNGDKDGALDEAKRWQTEQPGDIMALVALGETYEARGDVKTAARAYGSILELFSFRADSRRFAGERLERLADPGAIKLAADTYGKAAEQRPDHPASHRLYAFTLLKAGEHEKAFEAMKKGSMRSYPVGRFRGVDRILKEDLGLIASVWAAAAPARRNEIMTRLHAAGGSEENAPSLRFVLVWETDANDVDFHIYDGKGGHAYYGTPNLPSGGSLYADVTTGYGPECFTIRGAREKRAYPYTLQAHYYSRGPMGYGMGKLEVIDHDGQGHVSFEERPFVVMKDRAFVDLGSIEKTKANVTASLK